MSLPLLVQSSWRDLATINPEILAAAQFGNGWELREVNLEIEALQQRTSTIISQATIENKPGEHLHADTTSQILRNLASEGNICAAADEEVHISDDRIRPGSRAERVPFARYTRKKCARAKTFLALTLWGNCPLCRACLYIVTISPSPEPDTTDYDDLPVSVVETPSASEVAQAYRRLSRSIDSYLASTTGSDVGVNTVHRIQSWGQEDLVEMTGTRRGKWPRGAWKTAFRLASG